MFKFKVLFLVLFLVVGVISVGVNSTQAIVTISATSTVSDGVLTLTGAAASTWSLSTGALTINPAVDSALNLGSTTTTGAIAIGVANTGGITIGNGATVKTISIGAGNAVNTINIGSHATPVNVITIGGTASTLGFFGVTAVVRPTAYTQTYATADKTHAALTATTIAAAVAGAAPAGGTGAAAGGWDTAGNRDTAIATINALRTEMAEVRLDYEALLVDVTDLKQLVNSLIDDQQALGLVQ